MYKSINVMSGDCGGSRKATVPILRDEWSPGSRSVELGATSALQTEPPYLKFTSSTTFCFGCEVLYVRWLSQCELGRAYDACPTMPHGPDT
jgi:hypothetical protein